MRNAVIAAGLLGALSTVLWVVVNLRAAQRELDVEAKLEAKAEASLASWGQMKEQVVATVQPKTWLALSDLDSPGAPPIVSRRFAGNLMEVVELEDAMVDRQMLTTWNVDAGELFDVARANVRKLEWQMERRDGGLVACAIEGSPPTAVLTWPDPIVTLPFEGEPLVAFTYEEALVADSSRPATIDAMFDTLEPEADQLADDGKPAPVQLSGRVLAWRPDAGWEEWAPPDRWANRYKAWRAKADAIEHDRAAR